MPKINFVDGLPASPAALPLFNAAHDISDLGNQLFDALERLTREARPALGHIPGLSLEAFELAEAAMADAQRGVS